MGAGLTLSLSIIYRSTFHRWCLVQIIRGLALEDLPFLIEIALQVMLILFDDVILHAFQIVGAHCEYPITILPMERMTVFIVNSVVPEGTFRFDHLHRLGNGNVAGQKTQNVHMITCSIDNDRYPAQVFDDTSHIGKHPQAEVFAQAGIPVADAEHDMIEKKGQRSAAHDVLL